MRSSSVFAAATKDALWIHSLAKRAFMALKWAGGLITLGSLLELLSQEFDQWIRQTSYVQRSSCKLDTMPATMTSGQLQPRHPNKRALPDMPHGMAW